MYRIVLPNKIDIVVVSYGGVGTSFLLDFLAQYKTTNSSRDIDGFKHSPLPPISFNRNVKFVYVYGNPQMAAASLFLRNYAIPHSIKLQRWIDKNTSSIPNGMTLQEYASLGVDRFHFENHFFNWYDKYLPCIPTLFVRYETIFDNIEHILEFVGIPKSGINRFPEKKKRASTKEGIPAETVKYLDDMYGEFSEKLVKLNDIEIRQDGRRSIFSVKYMDTQYRKALAGQVANEHPKTFAMLKKIKQLTNRST